MFLVVKKTKLQHPEQQHRNARKENGNPTTKTDSIFVRYLSSANGTEPSWHPRARRLNGILNGVSRRQTPLNWRSRRWRSADRRRRGVTGTSVEALARRPQHRRARHAARGSWELTWACCTYECKLSAWTLLLSWEFLLVLSFSCRDSCLRVACSNVCRHYYYNVYNITVR